MESLSRNNLQRFLVPLASAVVFFFVIVFLIPYSAGYGSVKLPLASLVFSLRNFGATDPTATTVDSTYILFVPPIFGYLVFLRWKELCRAPINRSGDKIGMGIMLMGVLLYWFGMRAENQLFGYAAVQILLAGVILWLWGWAVFRMLLFPWAFFIFVWPMPFLDPLVAFPLRMVMSTLASHLLPLMGIPCIQNGTALLSPPDTLHGIPLGAQFEIDIADPCSGIRSLFALLMFSALFAYLFVDRLWQQWIVFLSAFPLAILGNLIRVILLVLGSIFFGSAFAIGTSDNPSWFHEGCGFLIYAVALGAEFLIASLLTRQWNRPEVFSESPSHAG
jgi:exosortase